MGAKGSKSKISTPPIAPIIINNNKNTNTPNPNLNQQLTSVFRPLEEEDDRVKKVMQNLNEIITFETAKYSKNAPHSCSKNIILFSQHSGQCWSDSASVALIFTEIIGKRVQNVFTKVSMEVLANQLKSWCTQNSEYIISLANDQDYLRTNIDTFVYYLVQYFICLYERFRSWKERQTEQPMLPMRRQASHALSLCQEAAGIHIVDMLKKTSTTNIIIPLHKNYLSESRTLIKKQNINETDIFCSKQGSDSKVFAKILSIFMLFLFPECSIRSFEDFNLLSLSENELNITKLNIQNLTIIQNTYTDFHEISFPDNSHILSIVATLLTLDNTGHVITMLRCSDNQGYIYDDNYKTGLQETKFLDYIEEIKTIHLHPNILTKYLYCMPIPNREEIWEKLEKKPKSLNFIKKVVSSIYKETIIDNTVELYNINTKETNTYTVEGWDKLKKAIQFVSEMYYIMSIDYAYCIPKEEPNIQTGNHKTANNHTTANNTQGGRRLHRNRHTVRRRRHRRRVGSRRLGHHRK
jgi:hypothetical protein